MPFICSKFIMSLLAVHALSGQAGALVTFDGDFCKESMCNEGTKKFSFNPKLLQHPSY